MTQVTIHVEGAAEFMRRFGQDALLDALDAPMRRATMRLQRDMADYPPARPRQTYVRTGLYGRAWTTDTERTASTLTGKVGTNVRYAPFVGSSRFQSRIHRGRWTTDRQAIQRNRRAIFGDFSRTLRRELREAA